MAEEPQLSLSEEQLENAVNEIDGDTNTENKEVSKDESTRAETSLKTEDKSEETEQVNEEQKEESKEGKEEEWDSKKGFHTHPAWQKLQAERDEAVARTKKLDEYEQKLGEFNPEEILEIKQAADILKRNPQLAEKVRNIINEHPYAKEEVDKSVRELSEKIQNLETQMTVEKATSNINRMISDNKVDSKTEPLLRELLATRVSSGRVNINDANSIKQLFDRTLKDVENYKRNLLSSYATDKKKDGVPKSPSDRGKVVVAKKESAEMEDIVNEIATGLKQAEE